MASDRPESEAPAGAPEADGRTRAPRRAVRLLFHVVFVGGCVAATIGDGAWLDLRRLGAERDAAEHELVLTRARLERERRNVERLRDDPRVLERVAREKLGYARPGEIVFLLPPEPDEPPAPEGLP